MVHVRDKEILYIFVKQIAFSSTVKLGRYINLIPSLPDVLLLEKFCLEFCTIENNSLIQHYKKTMKLFTEFSSITLRILKVFSGKCLHEKF